MSKKEKRITLVNKFIDDIINSLNEGNITGQFFTVVEPLTGNTEEHIKKAIHILRAHIPPGLKISSVYKPETSYADIRYGIFYTVHVADMYLPNTIVSTVSFLTNQIILSLKEGRQSIVLDSKCGSNLVFIKNAMRVIDSFKIPGLIIKIDKLNSDTQKIKINFPTSIKANTNKLVHKLQDRKEKWIKLYKHVSRPTIESTSTYISYLTNERYKLNTSSVELQEVDVSLSI